VSKIDWKDNLAKWPFYPSSHKKVLRNLDLNGEAGRVERIKQRLCKRHLQLR